MIELAKAELGRCGYDEERRGSEGSVVGGEERASQYLWNTPAVCQKSYIDPKSSDRFNAGETILSVLYLLG